MQHIEQRYLFPRNQNNDKHYWMCVPIHPTPPHPTCTPMTVFVSQVQPMGATQDKTSTKGSQINSNNRSHSEKLPSWKHQGSSFASSPFCRAFCSVIATTLLIQTDYLPTSSRSLKAKKYYDVIKRLEPSSPGLALNMNVVQKKMEWLEWKYDAGATPDQKYWNGRKSSLIKKLFGPTCKNALIMLMHSECTIFHVV